MLQTARTLIVALLALLTLGPFTAQARDNAVDEALVILSSASQQTQGMAMVLANAMAQQGAKVHVLLCDRAGDLALKDDQTEPMKPRNVTPGQLLRALLDKGGSARVCALYLPNSEHTPADLIEGVSVAMPPEIAGQMLNPDIPTFTF